MSEFESLLSQKKILTEKLRELCGGSIKETWSTEKILSAIKSQRWYFFENKPKLLFDGNTALLWTNLKFFPYLKRTTYEGYTTEEVRKLIGETNKTGFDGRKDWVVPTPEELWDLIEDETFPYQQGDFRQINNEPHWFINREGKYCSKNLYNRRGDAKSDITELTEQQRCCAILCSHAFVPNKFSQEPEQLLEVFVKNEVVPIFQNAADTELFREIYVVKPEIQQQLDEVQQKIDALCNTEELSPKIDWRALKMKFDDDSDASPVRYSDSVQNLAAHLLTKLDDYEVDKAKPISEMLKLSPPKEFLPDLLRVRAELENVLSQSKKLREELQAVDDLEDLARIESAPRPKFALVAEALVGKVKRILENVDLYERQPDFVKSACSTLNQQFVNPTFYYENPTHWDASSKLLMMLIRYVKEGHLLMIHVDNATVAYQALQQLFNYRKALCELYGKSSTHPTPEEFSARVDTFKKNLKELAPKLDDEDERRWVENWAGKLR